MKLKQLQYTGEKTNGISLQLYKSYKTITISALRPVYELTDKDDDSQAAINYYKLNFPSSIQCITSDDDTPKVDNKVTEEVIIDSDEDTEEVIIESDEDIKEDNSNEYIAEDTTSDHIELSDEELRSKLESVDRSTIKEALEKADPELKLGRKSKDTIISETIDKYRDVLESLTN